MSLIETIIRPLGHLLRKKRAGEKASIQYYPELQTNKTFPLLSDSFSNNGIIPLLHSGIGRGENVSPELHWEKVPKQTKQFLLVIEDIDVPFKKPILHGIALFSSKYKSIPEGGLSPDNKQICFIPSRGRLGYFGPRPLPGHGNHRYRFHLFALDRFISETDKIKNFEELLPFVNGHVIGRATIQGNQSQT